MATTRHGQIGVGVESYGGFVAKVGGEGTGPHDPGLITRLTQCGIGGRRYAGFVAKGEVEPEPTPTGQVERGGTSKRDKRRKRRLPRYYYEDKKLPVPVEPELQEVDEPVVQETEPVPVPLAIEGLTARIAAEAREKLDARLKRRRRMMRVALIAAALDEDE